MDKTPVNSKIDGIYSGKTFQRPSYRQDPNYKHDMEYCVQVQEYMYSAHLRGQSGIPISEHNRFAENRAYGNTKQPIEIYKAKYSTDINLQTYTGQYDDYNPEDEQSKRGGYMNIIWKLIDVFSKIKDYYHSTYDNAEYDIIASAIDQKSGADREQMDTQMRMYKDWKPVIDELTQLGGLPDWKPDFIPESDDEVDMEINAQGFKLLHEKFIEELVKHTSDISDYLEIIKPKHIDDHLEVGYLAARMYYDIKDHKRKWKYTDPDPLYTGIQGSKIMNFKDAEWGFTIEMEKVSSLVGLIYPNDPDKEYKVICDNAQKYLGEWGNNSSWDYYADEKERYSILGDFKVPVMHSSWIDYDTERKIIFTSLTGSPMRSIDLEFGEKKNKKDIRYLKLRTEKSGHIQETNIPRLYNGSLLLGTKISYNNGLSNYQSYPPRIDLVMIKTSSNPMVQRCIPHIDQIELGWFKHQNALVRMRLDTVAINTDLLVKGTTGGKLDDPREQYVAMLQSGELLYSLKDWDGQGAYPRLYENIPGGMGKALQDIQATINNSRQEIEIETGIPQVMMGAAPEPRVPGKATEAAMQASLNITKPVITHIMWMKNNLAERTANSFDALFKTDPESVKSYEQVIGKNGVEVMRKAVDYAKYGIKLEPRPDETSWERLIQLIDMSIQNKEIRGDAAAKLDQMRQNNYTYKQINAYYQKAIHKNDERLDKIGQQQQKNQMDMMQAGAQQKDQLAGNDAQRESLLNNQVEQHKDQREQNKGENKIHQIMIKNATT